MHLFSLARKYLLSSWVMEDWCLSGIDLVFFCHWRLLLCIQFEGQFKGLDSCAQLPLNNHTHSNCAFSLSCSHLRQLITLPHWHFRYFYGISAHLRGYWVAVLCIPPARCAFLTSSHSRWMDCFHWMQGSQFWLNSFTVNFGLIGLVKI